MNTTPYTKLEHVDMKCFACGPENPHGLKMKFETNGEKLRSFVTIPDYMIGWSNLVHGGILSTILDEIMSWSAIQLTQRLILTKNLKIEYLKPVTMGQHLTATGFIKERIDERNAVVAGKILNDKGQLCTQSQGDFALFTPEAFRKLNILPDDLIDEMVRNF